MFYPCLAGRRRACVGAARGRALVGTCVREAAVRFLNIPFLCTLTLLDMSVLRRTSTVCSCAATSSIVFGRL